MSLQLVLLSHWGTCRNISLKITLPKILWYTHKQVRYHNFMEKTVAQTSIFRDSTICLLLMSSSLKACNSFLGLSPSSSSTGTIWCTPCAWLRNMRMSSMGPEVLHKSMRLPCSQLQWRKRVLKWLQQVRRWEDKQGRTMLPGAICWVQSCVRWSVKWGRCVWVCSSFKAVAIRLHCRSGNLSGSVPNQSYADILLCGN